MHESIPVDGKMLYCRQDNVFTAGSYQLEEDLTEIQIEPYVLTLMTVQQAIEHQVLPLSKQNGVLILVTSQIENLKNSGKFTKLFGPLKFLITDSNNIKNGIKRHYKYQQEFETPKKLILDAEQTTISGEKSIDETGSTLAQFVDNILRQAIDLKASDVHIAPSRRMSRVLFRINGKMINMSDELRIRNANHIKVINRIKTLCTPAIDVSQTMVPQDGAFEYIYGSEQLDCRVNILPDIKGQKLALRLHYSTAALKTLDSIGFQPDDLKIIRQLLEVPAGMFLVTGPTGSGKTTTLYACLQHYDADSENIITIEDPVEVKVEEFTQVQLRRTENLRVDLTFEKVLRAVLRQDPDIILVGEIRDAETAKIAIEASQTGHRVFSTLHTQGSISTVSRLKSMDVDQFGLLTEMVVIVSQRLVGITCPFCAKRYELTESDKAILTKQEAELLLTGKLMASQGCQRCHFSGVSGRTAVAEFLIFDDEVRDFLSREYGVSETKRYLREHKGFRTMWEKGLEQVHSGIVSFKELCSNISIDSRVGGTS